MKLSLAGGTRAASGARVCVRALWLGAALALLCVASIAATLPSGFTETQITGLSNPTAMAFAPDGRLFVCQQGGQLRVIKNGALLATPFVSLTVDSAGERGLLGVAFDPNFATNRFVYVYYTATTPSVHNRVSRFTANPANPDVATAGSEVVLLDLNNLSGATNHNGGAIHFGADGRLYIAVGENANPANAQTLSNLLGKVLRINADGSIPTDNPFFGTATGNNRAIWALGLRNPFTFAIQPGTGRIFINDVGQNTWEEINDGIAGSNYGWSICEGFCSPPDARFRDPLYQYAHTTGTPTGCAIAGGAFYNPPTVQFPATYVGKYFFADLCGNYIRYVDPNAGPPIPSSTAFATGLSSPVDLQVASDGSLWYLQRGGGLVGRIQFPAGQVPPSISQHPSNQNVNVGQTATFSCAATGATPLNYQWQRNNADISGANSSSYTTPPTTAGDNGAQFRCVVTNAFGSATSNNATLTVTTPTVPAGSVIISEFRFRGPAGVTDEFIELYNNTDADITVQSVDGTAGWTLDGRNPDQPIFYTVVTIPNGTVIPAREHYLVTNSGVVTDNGSFPGYSLGAAATGDITYSTDLPDGSGLALFTTTNFNNFTTATRLDSVGFSGVTDTLYREGAGLAPAAGIANDAQFSFVRKLTSGLPQDTNDNAQDFVLVATDPAAVTTATAVRGAPGPENLASPLQRNATVKAGLVDPSQPSTAPPNRVRDTTPVTNGPQGTLVIRRRFRNNTGTIVTALRFRIVDITTTNTPNPGGGAQADLRALDSTDTTITVGGSPVTIKGTTVEQPGTLTQPQGGGLNSSLVVALPGGSLAPNASVNVQFTLGVNGSGSFRFLINVEAATGAGLQKVSTARTGKMHH
jgi:glucose/arabinose dehydrogenase